MGATPLAKQMFEANAKVNEAFDVLRKIHAREDATAEEVERQEAVIHSRHDELIQIASQWAPYLFN